jgi:hypothetical protein
MLFDDLILRVASLAILVSNPTRESLLNNLVRETLLSLSERELTLETHKLASTTLGAVGSESQAGPYQHHCSHRSISIQ